MKIIHVVLGKANPNRLNGVNKVVYSLVGTQLEMGMHVEVWGITGDVKGDRSHAFFELKLFEKNKVPFQVDPELKKAIAMEPGSTCFHVHGGFVPEFYTLSKIIKKAGKSFVFTPHGTYSEGAINNSRPGIKGAYFRLIEKSLIKNASSVQCLGRIEQQDLLKRFPDAKTTLIPNGQEKLGLEKKHEEDGPLVFGFCGRVTRHQKGLDLLIEGYIQFLRLKPDANVVLSLIGDGEYLTELKEIVKQANISSKVVFHGKRFGDEKFDLMNSFDVFFHSSRSEGLPMAVLEAATLGKPIVVSRFTSMDHYVEQYDAGWVLNKNTVDEITESMVMAHLAPTIRRKKGGNAEGMVEQEFAWKKIAESLKEIYQDEVC